MFSSSLTSISMLKESFVRASLYERMLCLELLQMIRRFARECADAAQCAPVNVVVIMICLTRMA